MSYGSFRKKQSPEGTYEPLIDVVPGSKTQGYVSQMNNWLGRVMDDQQMENLVREMMDFFFVKYPKIVQFEPFLVYKLIPRRTYYFWVKKFKLLEEANDLVIMTLGQRREAGALNNTLNANTIHVTMSHYSDVWKEVAEWRAKLQAQAKLSETSNPSTLFVEIPPTNNLQSSTSDDPVTNGE